MKPTTTCSSWKSQGYCAPGYKSNGLNIGSYWCPATCGKCNAPKAPMPALGTNYYYVDTGHFVGLAYDGSTPINFKTACCGATSPQLKFDGVAQKCRNNVKCQHVFRMGPLPVGTYRIEPMHGDLYHGNYRYYYDLTMLSVSNPSGRSDFLIHGGGCGDDNTKPNTSYKYYDYIWSSTYNRYVTSGSGWNGSDYVRNSEGCIVIDDENTRRLIKGSAKSSTGAYTFQSKLIVSATDPGLY